MNIIHFVTEPAEEPGNRPAAALERDTLILRAGTELFAKLGFEATRMSMVAKRAGVAVGTIYLRYPNKRALLGGVIRSLEASLADGLLRAAEEDLPWQDRFAHIFGAMVDAVSRSPEVGAIMRLASHAELDHYESGGVIRAAIEQIVTRAQGMGAFRSSISPAIVAAVAYGMVEGVMNHMMSADAEDADAYVAALADAASRWLVADATTTGS